MGKGVQGPHGSDAPSAFSAVIERLVEEFREPVTTLISGNALLPVDGLQIDVRSAGDRATLTLTQPGIGFKVAIELRAIPIHQDPRDPLPVPDRWRNSNLVSGASVWELFNCEVCGVLLLRN